MKGTCRSPTSARSAATCTALPGGTSAGLLPRPARSAAPRTSRSRDTGARVRPGLTGAGSVRYHCERSAASATCPRPYGHCICFKGNGQGEAHNLAGAQLYQRTLRCTSRGRRDASTGAAKKSAHGTPASTVAPATTRPARSVIPSAPRIAGAKAELPGYLFLSGPAARIPLDAKGRAPLGFCPPC